MREDQAVSSVISVILMVAIAVILSTVVSVFVLDFTEDVDDPAPVVSDTTGEFMITPPGKSAGQNQIVQITHDSGDGIDVNEIEIIVRASGPSLNTEARLVSLPASGGTIDSSNIDGNEDLIDESAYADIIVSDDPNRWSAGRTIQFRVATGGADFRESGDADELEVIIIHTESNAILSEHTFTP